jgi:hypothetical protein
MSTAIAQDSTTEMDLVLEMYKSIRSWAIFSLILGGLSVISIGKLDPGWGIVLIIIAILSWKVKIPGMFIVYAVIMAWAAFSNLVSGFSGSERWWLVLALGQAYWSIAIIKQFRKYRRLPLQELYQSGGWAADLPPLQNETLIVNRFAIIGTILAGISSILLPGLCIATFVIGITAQSTEVPGMMIWLMSGVMDVSVLALGLSCAALFSRTEQKALSISGVVMSGLQLVIWICILLLGAWSQLAGSS